MMLVRKVNNSCSAAGDAFFMGSMDAARIGLVLSFESLGALPEFVFGLELEPRPSRDDLLKVPQGLAQSFA